MASAMTVGSCFSGVGGFDLGFEQAGLTVRWQVEREPCAVAILQHRWPGMPVVRDIHAVACGRARNRRRHDLTLAPVDVLCGGFPCQDVSVAGRRKGLAGARSGLFFVFMRMVRLYKPRTVVLENVPGLLSSRDGRDFATVLDALAECGYGWAYRILDSRFFGVPQRRRRVFIVGCAGGEFERARTILFEPESRGGDSAAGDETRADVAATLRGRSHRAGVNAPGRGGEDDQNLVYPISSDCASGRSGTANTMSADAEGRYRLRPPSLGVGAVGSPSFSITAGAVPAVFGVHANQRGELRTSDLAGSLNGSRSGKQFEGVFATLNSGGNDGDFRTEPGEHLVAHAPTSSMHKRHDEDTDTLVPTLTQSMGHHGYGSDRGDGNHLITTVQNTGQGWWNESDCAAAIRTPEGSGALEANCAVSAAGVRRLTPLECERLQSFPDFWTCLCGAQSTAACKCPDSPRYKALGNAVTVSVARWIGQRILAVA